MISTPRTGTDAGVNARGATRIIGAMAVFTVAALFVGCSCPNESPPDGLTPVKREDGRLVIEGGPVRVPGASTTTVEFTRSRRPSPAVTLTVVGRAGKPGRSVVAIVDTGSDDVMRLSETARRDIKPWVWKESVGKVRVWALGQGGVTLGACESVTLGDATLRGVPVELSGPASTGAEPFSSIGIGFLRLWRFAAFDWRRSQLTLADDVPGAHGEDVSFRWWHPLAKSETHPFMVIEARIGDQPLDFMLDTGFEADIALASSLSCKPPWKGALDMQGGGLARTASDAKPVRMYRLSRPFTLGGRTFERLTVLVFEDSSAPPGAEMLPIIGAPLLRRFSSVSIDFEARRVTLAAD